MTDLRDRLGALFVSPAAAVPLRNAARSAPGARAAPAALPASVAVLGGSEAAVLAVAVAAALARRRRTSAALVCRWIGCTAPALAWSPPAAGGAARLAAVLRERGHETRATGRVAIVDLDPDGRAAAAEAARAAAAAGEAPVVLALSGPRPDAFDSALVHQDVVVVTHVAARGGVAAALAREQLAAALPGVPVHVVAAGRAPRLAACAPFLAARTPAVLATVLDDLAAAP